VVRACVSVALGLTTTALGTLLPHSAGQQHAPGIVWLLPAGRRGRG
jgi:hypothetical protein